jgi:hypothetical protein
MYSSLPVGGTPPPRFVPPGHRCTATQVPLEGYHGWCNKRHRVEGAAFPQPRCGPRRQQMISEINVPVRRPTYGSRPVLPWPARKLSTQKTQLRTKSKGTITAHEMQTRNCSTLQHTRCKCGAADDGKCCTLPQRHCCTQLPSPAKKHKDWHARTSPIDESLQRAPRRSRGFCGQVGPKSNRKPAQQIPAKLLSGTRRGSWCPDSKNKLYKGGPAGSQ